MVRLPASPLSIVTLSSVALRRASSGTHGCSRVTRSRLKRSRSNMGRAADYTFCSHRARAVHGRVHGQDVHAFARRANQSVARRRCQPRGRSDGVLARERLLERADHLLDLPRDAVRLEVHPPGLAHQRGAADAAARQLALAHLALDGLVRDHRDAEPAPDHRLDDLDVLGLHHHARADRFAQEELVDHAPRVRAGLVQDERLPHQVLRLHARALAPAGATGRSPASALRASPGP